MKKVTYFDVEYANSKNKSICQIGIMCEDFETGEPFYPELEIYINPEDGFDLNCTRIHGITAAKVKDELNFPEVWKKIEKYFTNAVIIGHNVASSDLDALVKALRRYKLDIPEFYYICTYELARTFVHPYCVPNFKLSSLCDYFEIDIDNEHNAFDDACACADLLKAIIESYEFDVDDYVKKYIPNDTYEQDAFIADSELRKAISEFYGVIRGFSIDNIINDDEVAYIKEWRESNYKYINHKEIKNIIAVIDDILADDVITLDEMMDLQNAIQSYLDIVSTSEITLATQILDGILKGIIVDEEISESECKNLRQWLYDHIYLSNHFPFDKTIALIDSALEDNIITKEESAYITSVIKDLLNPVDALKEQVYSVDGKHVCLSGDFEYGKKPKVEEYIVARNGIIDSTVKKTTDILLIGGLGCQAYSNGTYGTKVKKAIEYNEKGCNIQIIKESDFFATIK